MTMKKKAMKDLTVHRVDGVESPATGRSFIVMKSDDPAEILANARELATAADAVLKGLLSNATLSVDAETGTALCALGDLLEVDATAHVKEAVARHAAIKSTPEPTPTPEPEPEPTAVSPEPLTTAALDAWLNKAQDSIVAATIKALQDMAARDEDEETAPVNVTKSRQLPPDGERKRPVTKAAPKMGEGLFANLVFGN